MKKRRSQGKKTGMILLMRMLFSAVALAVEPNPKDPAFVDAMHKIRLKQQEEEASVVRVISQPVGVLEQKVCTPAERARQRIRDLGKKETTAGTVTVEAGHGEVNVEGNSGEINNSVNIQVVNPNERSCL